MSFLSRQLRASFQRATLPAPHLLPVPDENDQGTQPDAEQLQHVVQGAHHPEGTGQGDIGKVFWKATEQFARIMNDSGFVRLRRLGTDEIVGTDDRKGLLERYFSLMSENDVALQDIDLSAKGMRIGDNYLCLHTLSDTEDLPGKVATDSRYERLSTDRSDCRLSVCQSRGTAASLQPCL